MYKKELDSLISSNSLPKSIMLYGECEYFIKYYGDKIASVFGKKDEILSFYFDEYEYKGAKNFISQASLFEDKNILIIKHDKKIPKKELDTLVSLCHKNSKSYFIFECYGDDLKAKEMAKSFAKSKSASFVRFFKPYPREAATVLAKLSKEKGLDIDPYALQHLYFIQNEDLSLSAAELDKLSLLDRKITVQDIDRLVYSLGSVGLDDMIEKLMLKQDIKSSLHRLLESGSSDEVTVINALENYITQLFMFHIYIKIYGKVDTKEILGYNMPPFIANKRADLSIKIPLEKYRDILNFLTDTELKLKTSQNIDKNSLLFSALIKLQTFL